jgi:hypothetical protein
MQQTRWQRWPFAFGPGGRYAGRGGLLLLFLIGGPVHADGPRPSIDTEFSYTTDSNITRAQNDPDIRADRALGVGIGLSLNQPIDAHTRMLSRVFVRGEAFAENTKLTNAAAGASATFQYRTSGHLLAPTFGVFARLSVAQFRSDIRNSTFYTGGLSFNKNLTDRVVTTVIISGTVRDSDSLVFDTRDGSALLNIDYQLRGGSAWYLSYNFLGGDTVSTGAPTLQILDAAKAVVADDAFGGAAANQFAYRIHAYTHVVTLGFNFSIAVHHALDLSARYAHADADNDLTYDRTLYSVAYLARF